MAFVIVGHYGYSRRSSQMAASRPRSVYAAIDVAAAWVVVGYHRTVDDRYEPLVLTACGI